VNNLSLQLISPDKEYFAGIVEMVVLPGENGDFSVLPDHAPIITYLRPGKISIIVERGKELSYFVASGFVKVDNNNCHVLVDYIKSESDLNESDLKKELASIFEKIENEKDQEVIKRLMERKIILEEEINFSEHIS
tara:strand:- start:1063 stop:1470 length:408 start_codon:yes stop_codon:yes gene_type:complete